MINETKSHPVDEAYLAREAAASAEAFAELYRRYVTRIYRYHMAYTGNIKDAEDLTSQTFMAALGSIHSYRGDGCIAAWLMGIASRKRALFFRGRKIEFPLDAALHIASPDLPTDKAAFSRLRLESISRAIKQLSPDRAEAIVLHFFGELSYLEIGRVLKKTEASVKMLVSRGLKDLRERTSLASELEK